MITTSDNPWAEINSAAEGRITRRRVTDQTHHSMFWIRDSSNRPGLLVEIDENISPSALRQAKISIRHIAFDVRKMPEDRITALILMLEDSQHWDVFLKLCLDLIERVVSASDDDDVFQVVFRRLKKWQSLLSGKSGSLLSASEIQGLYAELYFISEMLAGDESRAEMLIRGWEGPDRTQQDFILDDMAVEIKSLAGNQRGKVRISSEDQLDTHLSTLYLRVYFLAELTESNDAESLNAIVRRISGQLRDRDNRDLFERKLTAARYIDIPDYESPYFRVKEFRTYLVNEDFPRLTRLTMPEGVEAVSYDLVLAGIERFRTATDLTGN